MHMPARSCFPVPEGIDNIQAALLEPLGVAIHAVDLSHIRVGHSVAILGAGPIGLLLLQVAKLAGADPIYISDLYSWRLALAEKYGGLAIHCGKQDAVQQILKVTHGRGVDVAIEAAWADQTIEQAAEMTRLGGRVVLVGIPSDDRLSMKHSTARRKGLTLVFSRRMKHVYLRALQLAEHGLVDLHGLVSHRFPLKQVVKAFKLNAAYTDNVVKVMIEN
jgi:L-iditol 2-dehydrogenase